MAEVAILLNLFRVIIVAHSSRIPRPADSPSDLNDEQTNNCSGASQFDRLSDVRPDGIRHGGVQPAIGRSLRWPTSRRNSLQHLPSDQRHFASWQEPRCSEFCRHQPNAVDERTCHQGLSPYLPPHDAQLHSESRRNRLGHCLHSKSRSEVGWYLDTLSRRDYPCGLRQLSGAFGTLYASLSQFGPISATRRRPLHASWPQAGPQVVRPPALESESPFHRVSSESLWRDSEVTECGSARPLAVEHRTRPPRTRNVENGRVGVWRGWR
jgi:hypothetical protein